MDDMLADLTVWDLENRLHDIDREIRKAREAVEAIPALEELRRKFEERLAVLLRGQGQEPPTEGPIAVES